MQAIVLVINIIIMTVVILFVAPDQLASLQKDSVEVGHYPKYVFKKDVGHYTKYFRGASLSTSALCVYLLFALCVYLLFALCVYLLSILSRYV